MSQKKPKLGQNFLTDPSARQRIVEALGDISSSTVLEIGPGRGALTDLLAARAQNLIAVELDRALAPRLTEKWKSCESCCHSAGGYFGAGTGRRAKDDRDRGRLAPGRGRKSAVLHYLRHSAAPVRAGSLHFRALSSWCRKKLQTDWLRLLGRALMEFYLQPRRCTDMSRNYLRCRRKHLRLRRV